MHETDATTIVSRLVVDRGVLLYIGIGLRYVRLRLVVVVVRDEVLDCVPRQHLAELVSELGGESLIRQHYQHWPLQSLGKPGNRGGLAGPGRAEQHRVLGAAGYALLHLGNGSWLVPGWNHLRYHLERGDTPLQVGHWAHVISSACCTLSTVG
jgi:hypothetical protein